MLSNVKLFCLKILGIGLELYVLMLSTKPGQRYMVSLDLSFLINQFIKFLAFKDSLIIYLFTLFHLGLEPTTGQFSCHTHGIANLLFHSDFCKKYEDCKPAVSCV